MTAFTISRRVLCSIVALLIAGITNGQPAIDEALMSAAQSVMPAELSGDEIRAFLEGGLWLDDASAVALSIPREDEYMTFVFRSQPDGSYSAQDVSWIANTVFGVWGYPRAEIERFETTPLRWELGREGNLLLYARTRGWRQGQRYTGTDVYLVFPDGTLTNR